jgi:hypothetical protein
MADEVKRLEDMYVHAKILSGMGWSLTVNGEEIHSEELAEHMRVALLVLGWLPEMPGDSLQWLKDKGYADDAEQYESFLDCID